MDSKQILMLWPRLAVLAAISRLSIDPRQVLVLCKILDHVWPSTADLNWRPGETPVSIPYRKLAEATGYHLNSVRPLVGLLEATGFIRLVCPDGKPKCIVVCWERLFAVDGMDRIPTPPVTPTSTPTTRIPILYPSNGLEGSLEGLDGTPTNPLEGSLEGPERSEVLATLNWMKAAMMRMSDEIQGLRLQLAENQSNMTAAGCVNPSNESDPLEAYNPSNDPHIYNINIDKCINKEGLDLREETRGEIAPPKAEAKKMFDDFKWSGNAYPLTPEKLRSNAFVESIWKEACAAGYWPSCAQGRIEFYATVHLALQKITPTDQKAAGMYLTAAVQRRAHSDKLWASREDLQWATNRIGRPEPATERPQSNVGPTPSSAPSPTSEELQALMARLSVDELRELVSRNQHAINYINHCVAEGLDPRLHKMVIMYVKSETKGRDLSTIQLALACSMSK